MAEIKDTRDKFEICIHGNCNTCPSYPKGSGEGLFCARGASQKPVEKRGCNCPECPVWIKNGLTGMYYCVNPHRQ